MSHPAVKAGMHHCGFSSTLEYINCGLPCVIFPHFGDQPYVAKSLTESGAAISLIWWVYALKEGADHKNHLFSRPMFQAADVTEAFRAVLEDPSYRHNAMRLRCAARS